MGDIGDVSISVIGDDSVSCSVSVICNSVISVIGDESICGMLVRRHFVCDICIGDIGDIGYASISVIGDDRVSCSVSVICNSVIGVIGDVSICGISDNSVI